MKKLIAFVVIAAAIGASADEKKNGASPTSTKPAPEVEVFKAFEGKWRCKGTMYLPAQMGGEQSTQSTMTIKKDLDGHWYSGEYKMNATKATPAMRGMMHWGYDPIDKQFVEMGVDNTGGMFHGTSAGMKGGQMIWNEEGLMMGKKSKMRTTVTKMSATAINVKAEIEGEPGKWVPMGSDTCQK